MSYRTAPRPRPGPQTCAPVPSPRGETGPGPRLAPPLASLNRRALPQPPPSSSTPPRPALPFPRPGPATLPPRSATGPSGLGVASGDEHSGRGESGPLGD